MAPQEVRPKRSERHKEIIHCTILIWVIQGIVNSRQIRHAQDIHGGLRITLYHSRAGDKLQHLRRPH